MSYLVLARKYRPQTFEEVRGQEHVVRVLSNAVERDRVHHAYVFSGARGVGKTTMARLLAKALNCEKGPTPSPCGTCEACRAIAAGEHPDVVEIDGASNTGVDNVRELRERVRYAPVLGRRKIYIIDEVHMLSQAAFNALLKTLEEPPPHVGFVFATTEPQKIPITIMSRCQRMEYRLLGIEGLSRHVEDILEREGVSVDPSIVALVVNEARGSVRDALSLLDQLLAYRAGEISMEEAQKALGVIESSLVQALVDALLARDAAPLLETVAEVAARGFDMVELAGLVLATLRDLRIAQVDIDLLSLAASEREHLLEQSKKIDGAHLHRLFDLMQRCVDDVARSSQPRLSLEMGLLRLMQAEPAVSIESLLSQLQNGAPEARLQPQPGASPPSPAAPPAPAAPAKVERDETPAAVSPSAGMTAPGDELSRGWHKVVAAVSARRPSLAALLEHAVPKHIGGGEIRIGFPADSFYYESGRDPETQSEIESILETAFGKRPKLRVEALDRVPEGGTIAQSRDDASQERRESLQKEARDEPGVKSAMEVLGAELKDIQLEEEA